MKKKILKNIFFEMLLTAVVWFVLRMAIELVFDTDETWKGIALWAVLCGITWVPFRRFLVKKGIIKDDFDYLNK